MHAKTYRHVCFLRLDLRFYEKPNRLQILQKNFLRLCTNSPWFIRNLQLHRDCKIEFITELIKNNAEIWFEQISIHSNKLQSTIITHAPRWDTKYMRPKHLLILHSLIDRLGVPIILPSLLLPIILIIIIIAIM
jgi:hypothetical protein